MKVIYLLLGVIFLAGCHPKKAGQTEPPKPSNAAQFKEELGVIIKSIRLYSEIESNLNARAREGKYDDNDKNLNDQTETLLPHSGMLLVQMQTNSYFTNLTAQQKTSLVEACNLIRYTLSLEPPAKHDPHAGDGVSRSMKTVNPMEDWYVEAAIIKNQLAILSNDAAAFNQFATDHLFRVNCALSRLESVYTGLPP